MSRMIYYHPLRLFKPDFKRLLHSRKAIGTSETYFVIPLSRVCSSFDFDFSIITLTSNVRNQRVPEAWPLGPVHVQRHQNSNQSNQTCGGNFHVELFYVHCCDCWHLWDCGECSPGYFSRSGYNLSFVDVATISNKTQKNIHSRHNQWQQQPRSSWGGPPSLSDLDLWRAWTQVCL